MSKNLSKIILLSIFFIIISGLFIFNNEKIYHQTITLKNIDDFEANKVFQFKNQYGEILDISEENLKTNLFSRINIKIMFANILRSLQSNKIHRYEFRKHKNYTDDEFKYLEKILDNIELEGAYFLNPDQLSDAIINIYANDLETANKIFSDYFIFCALNIVNDHLEESSRFSIYRDKIFEGFFKKYSSEIQFNNYKTNVLSIIENEKSFPLEGEYSSLRFSDQILSHFINLNNLIIEYLKTPSKLNYEKLILNYKNLAEDLEFLKVQKEAKEVISKIKIDEQNLYMKLRVNYLQSISEFNSLLNSKEMQFFHILKDDLIQDNSFRVKILSDEKIYKNFNLEKIENKQLISQIIESIKEAYYIKDVYNNLMLKNYDFVVKNNLKNQIIYENLKTDQKTLISYLSNKMSIVDNKLNISYFLSLFLFSIVSAIIIIGVSHSFKKES